MIRTSKTLLSNETMNKWFSYFTKVGFVEHHKKQMDTIQLIQDDSLQRLHEEKLKPDGKRNDNFILKLKRDIRENTRELLEYGLDAPVIAGTKNRLERRYGNPETASYYYYNKDYNYLPPSVHLDDQDQEN
jgi:hypothetical protein